MSKLRELKTYRDSKEFQDIIEVCKNKKDNIEQMIDTAFIEWEVDNEAKKSTHDLEFQRKLFFVDILERVQDKSVWAALLREDIQKDIDGITQFLRVRIKNEYGIAYSNPVYTDLDMLRYQAADNHFMMVRVDDLMEELKKPKKEKDDSVY